ncbi:MAG TPA: hypothetical protein VF112_09515 [Candidatus Dormibacteraeota bacterium]
MKNMQETEGTFKVEVHDILANDEHAVALAVVSGQRQGKSLSDRYTHVGSRQGRQDHRVVDLRGAPGPGRRLLGLTRPPAQAQVQPV